MDKILDKLNKAEQQLNLNKIRNKYPDIVIQAAENTISEAGARAKYGGSFEWGIGGLVLGNVYDSVDNDIECWDYLMKSGIINFERAIKSYAKTLRDIAVFYITEDVEQLLNEIGL